MNIDFSPFFKKYEDIVMTAETVFDRVKKQYPEYVVCQVGCSDCCHALFDLTLIEAMYVAHQFNRKFQGADREKLIEKANRSDRELYKIKKKAYKDFEAGKSEDDILMEMAETRSRCPLLNEADQCDLYEYRPITCRFYGIPTAIAGTGHTCGKSGFVTGEQYPTVNLDILFRKLYELSAEFVTEVKSKYVKMSDILVPVSMAMLTEYDEVYLGLADEKDEKKEEKK